MAVKKKKQVAATPPVVPQPEGLKSITHGGVTIEVGQVINYRTTLGKEARGTIVQFTVAEEGSYWMKMKHEVNAGTEWISFVVQLDYYSMKQLIKVN